MLFSAAGGADAGGLFGSPVLLFVVRISFLEFLFLLVISLFSACFRKNCARFYARSVGLPRAVEMQARCRDAFVCVLVRGSCSELLRRSCGGALRASAVRCRWSMLLAVRCVRRIGACGRMSRVYGPFSSESVTIAGGRVVSPEISVRSCLGVIY